MHPLHPYRMHGMQGRAGALAQGHFAERALLQSRFAERAVSQARFAERSGILVIKTLCKTIFCVSHSL
jgi:hypothetical protein